MKDIKKIVNKKCCEKKIQTKRKKEKIEHFIH
jgi:hypothetical protein